MARLDLHPVEWRRVMPVGMAARTKLNQHTVQPASDVRDTWRLKDGTSLTIRAAHEGDGALMQTLVHDLSLQSRYRRFFYALHELPPELLARFVEADPRGSISLLAVVRRQDEEVVVGMAQSIADPYPERAEFALLVADAWQRRGIAMRLLHNLMCIARAAGIARLEGDVLTDNEPMWWLLGRMEFLMDEHPDGPHLSKAWKVLDRPTRDCSALTALVGAHGREALHSPA
jgi:acetyltransferase